MKIVIVFCIVLLGMRICGGNSDDAYHTGYKDADIENARFILDLFGIEY